MAAGHQDGNAAADHSREQRRDAQAVLVAFLRRQVDEQERGFARERCGDAEDAPLLRARGEALRSRRRLPEARRDLEEALSLARDRELETLCLQELGILEREEGVLTGALLSRALEGARSLQRRALEGIILGNLGTVHRYRGEIAEARSLYGSALAIHREVGNVRSEMIALGNLGVNLGWNPLQRSARAATRPS